MLRIPLLALAVFIFTYASASAFALNRPLLANPNIACVTTLDLFLHKYYPYIRVQIVERIGGRVPYSDIDDVVQEVLLALYEGKAPEGTRFEDWVEDTCEQVIGAEARSLRWGSRTRGLGLKP